MTREYQFENAIIYITMSETSHKNIQTATEIFMKKVLKERNDYGHANSSKNISKE